VRILLILFLVMACHNKLPKVEEKIQAIEGHSLWVSKVVEKYSFISEGRIKGTSGTWITLLKLRSLSSPSEVSNYCFVYRIPDKKNSNGLLRFVIQNKGTCEDIYYQNEGIEFQEIESLWLEESLQECSLRLSFRIQNKKRRLCLKFLNIEAQDSGDKTMGDSSAILREHRGLIQLPHLKLAYPSKRLALHGSISDRFQSEKKPFLCHQVSSQCASLSQNTCDQCRWGWVEVIDSECKTAGSKYCALDRCGQKGEPACFRGWKHLGQQAKTYCEQKELGFCREGLMLHCDQGILKCW
jgi:hypothetical protein